MDLGISATGWAVGGDGAMGQWPHGTIKTPARGKDQDDTAWNARRFQIFNRGLVELLYNHRPDVLAYEVTRHAFGSSRGKRSTKGIEYRAGHALGRAQGWMDAALYLASSYGVAPARIVEVSSFEAKLRTTGNAGASKDAVRAYLEDTYRCHLEGWADAETDALAVLTAFKRNLEDRDLPGGIAPADPTSRRRPPREGSAPSPLLAPARSRRR